MESLSTQLWACASSAHDTSLLTSTSAPPDVQSLSGESRLRLGSQAAALLLQTLRMA